MKCPTCVTTDLLMTERMAIEIDYCPQCRGVWLDRGELDKIIERSTREALPVSPTMTPPAPNQMRPQYDKPLGYREDHHDGHYRGKKSFWNELFD